MVRKATMADKREIMAMMRDFYDSDAVIAPVADEHFEKTIEHCLKTDVYADLLVCERQGGLAGYALTAKTYSNEAGGMVLWIEELYAKPAFRGTGVGHELLNELLSHPYARFRLEIEEENTGAVRLYKSMGFDFFEYDQMIMEVNK